MIKLEVIVKTGPYSTGSVAIKNGHHITVRIPGSNHENCILIHKEFKGWKVELSHTQPGFGKPYLLNLTNQEKDDKIKISIAPQRDFIRTSLMDCTFKSLKHFTLTGPNITTNKSQADKTTNGMKLELVSYGTLRIFSHPLQIKDVSVRVIPKEGCTDVSDIYVDTGAVVRCTTFETNVDGHVFINGTITCGLFDKEKCLTVRIGTGDLHVNIDGVLGQKMDAKRPTKNASMTKILNVEIEKGNLTNFGSLCAHDYLKLLSNNLMLCSDSKHDTAQRGFDSFISLQKELGRLTDITPHPKIGSSLNDSRMLQAVQNLDCDSFISIVNEEIDPAVRIHGRSIQNEFKAVCGGRKDANDKDQHKKEIIRGGLATCEWRHGVIRAAVIECIVHQDIYDCSQLQGNNLHFDVGGSVSVVKPWTWKSGTISGLIRGDLLFYDNAMLRSFNQFQVLGNVTISKTSAVWAKEGGKLYCGQVFENQNVIVSEGNLGLDLGELKQDREGRIISKGDLLLALRDGQENSWFGYVQVDQHLFIQLEKKVSCDSECISSQCDVKFIGGDAQLVINKILIVEEGDLILEATDTSEIPNFLLFGELYANGINGITASVFTMPGASVDLTSSCNGETQPHRLEVITRCLEISVDSVMKCSSSRNKNSNIIDSPISANVLCKESISVHGKLQACTRYLRIEANSLNNSGKIELSYGIKNRNSIPSSLCITCENDALNSGTIRCEGNLNIKSDVLSNQRGVIESSFHLALDLGELKQDTEGRITSDRDISLILHNEQERLWYGYVHAKHFLFIQLEKKVSCHAECSAKECRVKFDGSNAQLLVNELLNVEGGPLILEAINASTSPDFVLNGTLKAKEIKGITASVCTMPGASVDLTCACNGEQETHAINVFTRSLEIKADSVMTCSCPRGQVNIMNGSPMSTNVLSKELISVHGKLQACTRYLRIEANSLNNSGKIELSYGIKNRNSIPSSLCITCENDALNSGTIRCEGNLNIKSDVLSNQRGVIESSFHLALDLGELKQDTEGRITSDRDISLILHNEQERLWYGYVHAKHFLFIQLEKKVSCHAECSAKECRVKFDGSNAQLLVNELLNVEGGPLILEAINASTSPDFVLNGTLKAKEIKGITASVCTMPGASVDLTCACNGEQETHAINVFTRSLEIKADSVMTCSCPRGQVNIMNGSPMSTNVLCKESISVHGKLQACTRYLRIEANSLNNSGKIELSYGIKNRNSIPSSLCITCENDALNSGTIRCEGNLNIKSDVLSNQRGVIESSFHLALDLGELKQDTEGRITSDRDISLILHNEQERLWYGYVHAKHFLFIQLEKKVSCHAECSAKECRVKFDGSNAQLLVNELLNVEGGPLILEAINASTSPDFVLNGTLKAKEIKGITASVCTMPGASVDLTCACNGEQETHAINVFTRSLEIKADSIMTCSCPRGQVNIMNGSPMSTNVLSKELISVHGKLQACTRYLRIEANSLNNSGKIELSYGIKNRNSIPSSLCITCENDALNSGTIRCEGNLNIKSDVLSNQRGVIESSFHLALDLGELKQDTEGRITSDRDISLILHNEQERLWYGYVHAKHFLFIQLEKKVSCHAECSAKECRVKFDGSNAQLLVNELLNVEGGPLILEAINASTSPDFVLNGTLKAKEIKGITASVCTMPGASVDLTCACNGEQETHAINVFTRSLEIKADSVMTCSCPRGQVNIMNGSPMSTNVLCKESISVHGKLQACTRYLRIEANSLNNSGKIELSYGINNRNSIPSSLCITCENDALNSGTIRCEGNLNIKSDVLSNQRGVIESSFHLALDLGELKQDTEGRITSDRDISLILHNEQERLWYGYVHAKHVLFIQLEKKVSCHAECSAKECCVIFDGSNAQLLVNELLNVEGGPLILEAINASTSPDFVLNGTLKAKEIKGITASVCTMPGASVDLTCACNGEQETHAINVFTRSLEIKADSVMTCSCPRGQVNIMNGSPMSTNVLSKELISVHGKLQACTRYLRIEANSLNNSGKIELSYGIKNRNSIPSSLCITCENDALNSGTIRCEGNLNIKSDVLSNQRGVIESSFHLALDLGELKQDTEGRITSDRDISLILHNEQERLWYGYVHAKHFLFIQLEKKVSCHAECSAKECRVKFDGSNAQLLVNELLNVEGGPLILEAINASTSPDFVLNGTLKAKEIKGITASVCTMPGASVDLTCACNGEQETHAINVFTRSLEIKADSVMTCSCPRGQVNMMNGSPMSTNVLCKESISVHGKFQACTRYLRIEANSLNNSGKIELSYGINNRNSIPSSLCITCENDALNSGTIRCEGNLNIKSDVLSNQRGVIESSFHLALDLGELKQDTEGRITSDRDISLILHNEQERLWYGYVHAKHVLFIQLEKKVSCHAECNAKECCVIFDGSNAQLLVNELLNVEGGPLILEAINASTSPDFVLNGTLKAKEIKGITASVCTMPGASVDLTCACNGEQETHAINVFTRSLEIKADSVMTCSCPRGQVNIMNGSPMSTNVLCKESISVHGKLQACTRYLRIEANSLNNSGKIELSYGINNRNSIPSSLCITCENDALNSGTIRCEGNLNIKSDVLSNQRGVIESSFHLALDLGELKQDTEGRITSDRDISLILHNEQERLWYGYVHAKHFLFIQLEKKVSCHAECSAKECRVKFDGSNAQLLVNELLNVEGGPLILEAINASTSPDFVLNGTLKAKEIKGITASVCTMPGASVDLTCACNGEQETHAINVFTRSLEIKADSIMTCSCPRGQVNIMNGSPMSTNVLSKELISVHGKLQACTRYLRIEANSLNNSGKIELSYGIKNRNSIPSSLCITCENDALNSGTIRCEGNLNIKSDVLSNQRGVIESSFHLALDLGELKQDTEGRITSDRDISLILHNEQERLWYGYVHAKHFLFIQLEKKVSCHAECSAKECRVKFDGSNAQLLVNELLNVEGGPLILEAINASTSPDFVLNGTLKAKEIKGITASVCTMPGASVDLTCACNGEQETHAINVFTRSLEIKADSVMTCSCPRGQVNIMNGSPMSTNVLSKELISVHGKLQACTRYLRIEANSLNNSGKIELSYGINNRNSIPSSLCITCENDALNSGTIRCEGNLNIKSDVLSNQRGVIESSFHLALDLGELKQDTEGRITSDRDISLILHNEQERLWYGYVHAKHVLFIQLEKKVSCHAECSAKECCVIFDGSNAQLLVNELLNVEGGPLILEAINASTSPDFVLNGTLKAKEIKGITASVCTMPGASVDLTCACNGEQETHAINVFTRSLEIKADSVMTCSCPRGQVNIMNGSPMSTNVLSKELISVHGKLQACTRYLRIEANSLNNSGKIELSYGIKNRNSIPSSLCITCENDALNSGTIRCEGNLNIKSDVLSNQRGVIESSFHLALDLGELKQDTEGRITSDRDISLILHNEQERLWYGYVHAKHVLFIQLEKKVSCHAECSAKECCVIFDGSNAQLLVNELLNVEGGPLILEAINASTSPDFVLNGTLKAKEIKGITASVCTMPGASVDLTCACNGEQETHAINVFTRSLEIKADSVMTCSCPRGQVNIMNGSPMSTNVLSKELISVHGKLQACTRYLRIEANSLNNSGKIELSYGINNRNSIPSSLCITCENDALNSGTIRCEGNLNIKSDVLSNQRGVIESSFHLALDLGELKQDTEGRITSDRDISLILHNEQERLWYGYVHAKHVLFIQLEKKVSCHAECSAKECCVIFDGSNAQLLVNELLNVEGGPLILEAINASTSPDFVLNGTLKAKEIKGITASVCTMPGASVDLTCACNGEQETHAINVFTRSLEIKADSVMTCSCPRGQVNIMNGSPMSTNVLSKELISVHGKLQACTRYLRIEANSLNNSGKIELSYGIKNRNSIPSSLCITCNKNALNRGTIKCDGDLIITSETLSNENGMIRSSLTLGIKLTSTDETTLSGQIYVDRHLYVYSQSHNEFSFSALGGKGEIIDTFVSPDKFEVTCEKGHLSIDSNIVSSEYNITTGKTDSFTSVEIKAKDVKVSGSMTNVSDLKLTAKKDLHLTEKGRICSCKTIEIKGEWITMAGSIEEFLSLQIEPWALLNSGKIESVLKESTVRLSSNLALVNSGTCKGQVTLLEAPFLLSLPGKEISDVNDVRSCELVGRERIKLESITCFLGGSTLKSNKLVENETVLLFKFLAYVSCTPDAKSLEAWSKAAESLKNIQSEYADNKVGEITDSLKSFKKGSMASAEIGLRIDQMYSMVNIFVADILKNGIESFDVPRLVLIITSESERYTKINIMKEKLLAIPHKARELRHRMKKKGIKGVESIMKRFAFSESKRKSNRSEGIHESGLYSLSEGVTFSDSAYEACFDESFCDEGVLSAGDVVVASKDIVMTKREKKAITMMMFADDVCKAGDITSDSLVIKSEGKAKLDGKIKSDNATIEAKSGIDLAYHDKSKGKKTAEHQFKNLTLKTDKMNQVNGLLKGEGVYEDLRISDQLDLAVTDQDIVLSRCNTDQLYKLKLNAKSVNVDNARVHCEKGVSITSDQTLNVSGSTISSQGSAILQSTEGNVSIDSSHVEASNVAAVKSDKGSISITAGSISGDEGALLKAKNDINVDPIETHHSSSSSKSGFFSSSKDSSSYSTVSKAHISSKSGSVAIVSEEGSVKATATEIDAAKNIAISAKKDVVIQDKVTIRKEEKVERNWLRQKRTFQRKEEHHSSTLAAGGSLSISSQDSNVSVIGTNSQVGGDMILHAAGTVLFKDRILPSSEQSHSSGISFSLDKELSIGEENRRLHQQRLAGCRTDVGGNLIVSGKNFDVKNAMAMDVGNMLIDAKNVNFEGAELNNTSSMTKWSVDLGINQLGISVGESRSREKKVINQNIKVQGRTHFTNAENINLTACNLDTGAISGNIENLNVISKQSEMEAFKNSTSIGFTTVEGCPVPNKFGKSQSSDVGKFVEKPSGIHCRESINQDEFQVGSLKLRGSSVTADGDIGNFAKNKISEKVYSYRSQSSSGFSIGVDKKGVELGMHCSNKFMSMEHEATIASSSGIVSEEIKKSVNTDISKHSRITAQHSSAFGINLQVSKHGVGAGLQTNDTSVGFCASKDKLGINAQHGDKGISLSGGKSGFSGSVQDGENSVGLGLSKNNVDFSVKTKDSAIGTSLGKGGISASVQHKNLSIAASTSKGTKSFQAKAGDFEAGITRDKNRDTGNKSTSASLKVADIGISGSASKGMKAIDFHAKDFKTGMKSERNKRTGKKTISGNIKVRDLELDGSKSKHSKSFKFKKGDFVTRVKQNKDRKTGNKTTSARLKAGELEVGGSTSNDSKSCELKVGEFQTALRQDKDTATGNKTTSARLKAGELEVGGSTSNDSKSCELKVGEFQTALRQDKDTATGNKTTSARLKAGELEVGGSTSNDSKSCELKVGEFQTALRQDKDTATGNKTTSARLKAGELEVGGSTSNDSKSCELKVGDFQTALRQDKDAATGNKTTSARLKAGELEVGGSTSNDSKSCELKVGDFQTALRQDKDAATGNKTTSARLKAGELEVGGSTSNDSKSCELKVGEFQTALRQDKDTATGNKTTSARLKAGELEVGGSTSNDSKSCELKVGDFQTALRQDKDTATGNKTTSARLKAGELEVGGSTSNDSKSCELKVGEFQTALRQDKDTATGNKTTSARLKAGELEVGGSTSNDSKSCELKVGDFQTALRQDKDAATGNKTTSARLKAGELEVGGSTSNDSKSCELKVGEFQTALRQDKDAATGNKTTSARLKAGELEVGGSTSNDSKSCELKVGDFQTRLRRDKDNDTGNKTTSARLKAGELEVGGSTSNDSKSCELKVGEFQTALRQDKDAATGNKTTSARLKAGELEVGGSTSNDSKSCELKVGEFQTALRQDKDAATGNKTTSARLKAGELEVGDSTSNDSKSCELKVGEFQTALRQDKDAATGNKTTSARLKAGELEVGGSTSNDSKSCELKVGKFQTGLRRDKDNDTGNKTTSGRLKAEELEVGGSTSNDSKSCELKVGKFQTGLRRDKDNDTGNKTTSARLKAEELEVGGSTSNDSKSCELKVGEFQTRNKTTSARLKAGDVEHVGSASKDSKSSI